MKSRHRNSEPPWKKGVEPILVLYSILAAVSGVFLTYALSEKDFTFASCLTFDIPLLFSIIFFIYSAEKITDALDESDVKKLVYSYVSYNLAVASLIWGLFSGIFMKFFGRSVLEFTWQHFFLWIGFLILYCFSAWKWISNFFWLLFTNKHSYHEYLQELEGKIEAEPDVKGGMKLFYQFRRFFRGEIIDIKFKEVNIELRPSTIDGVGLFTIKKFKKGEVIAEGIHLDDLELLVPWSEVSKVDTKIKTKINDFCVGTPDGFYPPPNNDFNRITPDWYMNHSCTGNVGFDEVGDFIALRSIEVDEELTYDYALAESSPKFELSCRCGEDNCRKIITGNDWKDKNIIGDKIHVMMPALKLEYQKII